MLELDDELREIRHEIVESRALIIKTNNLTNALSADLKSIAKRQQAYERRITISSVTAFVVFLVVLLGALKFAWDARVSEIRGEVESRNRELELLRREQKEMVRKQEDQARAEVKAAQYYELVRQNRRAEVLEQYESVRRENLTKTESVVFAEASERARNELAAITYAQGADKARQERWQEAATLFEDSLRYRGDGTKVPLLRLALAGAYRKSGKQREAIPLLQELAESLTERDLLDDVLALLAYCQADLSLWNESKESWKALLRRIPESKRGPEARLQLQQLSLAHP